MAVGLYADVHVPGPVILQLRLRGVDILAATEEQSNQLLDDQLLELATSFQRVLVTQDIRFRVLAENWQRTGRRFAGLVFAHQRHVSFRISSFFRISSVVIRIWQWRSVVRTSCALRFRHLDFVIPSDLVIRHSDLAMAVPCSAAKPISVN